MPWWVVLSGWLGVLLMLFFAGIPVFVTFLAVSVVSVLYFFGDAGFGMLANSIYDTTTTAALTTIPTFILMGELLFRSGTGAVLLKSVDTLIGKVGGRQYVVAISLSTVLGALSGSSMAVVAMLGRTVLPGMLQQGYNLRLSCGTLLAGACLAPIIPPSVLAIIAGTLANVSIAQLLIAGVIPGIVLALMFWVYVWWRLRIDQSLAPRMSAKELQGISWRHKLKALGAMLPFSAIIFMVIGLITLGIATPSEAGASGVLGALATAVYYRKFSWAILRDSVIGTGRLTTMVLVIMASSKLYSQLMAFTGASTDLANAVTTAGLGYWGMLFLMMLVPFVLCMFIDQIALMLIVIPIYAPLVAIQGYDPVWFWTLFLINVTVGGITPPFGYVAFVLKGAAPDVSLSDIYRASWPFVWIFMAAMGLFAVVPELILMLPRRL